MASNIGVQSLGDIILGEGELQEFSGAFGQAQAFILGKMGYGQAQARIKATYTQSGQAQAFIDNSQARVTEAYTEIFIQTAGNAVVTETYEEVLIQSAGNSRVTESYIEVFITAHKFGFGQAQAEILSPLRLRYGQAQAYIRLPAGFGQSQADIKQTYYSSGQAQANIKQTYRGHGQAQAYIVARGYGLGQAQGDIKATSNGFGQTQGDIKQTYYAHGQAQAILGAIYLAFGQAQADIKAVGRGLGQAQADIKQTYYGLGQAQAQIVTTYYGLGQSQADIKATGYGFGQAQADIKVTNFGSGQSQADIKQIYYVHGQAQGRVTGRGYASGQAQAKIAGGFTAGYGQAQATITAQYIHFLDTFSRIVSNVDTVQEMNYPDYGIYSGNSSVDSDGGTASFDGSKAVIPYRNGFATRYIGNVPVDITGESTLEMQFRLTDYVSVNDFYFELSISEPGVGDGSIVLYTDAGNIYLFGGTNFTSTTFVPGNGFTYKFKLFAGHTEAKAKWWLVNDGVTTYPEPSNWNLTVTPNVSFVGTRVWFYNEVFGSLGDTMEIDNLSIYAPEPPAWLAFGQAQALIRRTIAHGQARAWIKKEGQPRHGQAQGFIRKSAGYGQAQAQITRAQFRVGQAQALIFTPGRGHGQAQAFIHTTVPNGQAQGAIVVRGINNVAQAQAHILQKQWVMGQAQAQIRAFGFLRSGQAQALITGNVQDSYGQSMATIKTASNGFGQAQAMIVSLRGFGQAQADIKQISRGFGQAEAYIIRRQGYGQAQGYVRTGTATNGYGQAQGFIRYSQIAVGQAQAYIRKGAGYGQAQARIKSFGQIGTGNSQAFIRRTDTRTGSGQSAAQIKRNDPVGQAQALIEGGRYLVKYNGYQLPGYAQVEDYDSTEGVYEPDVSYQDGPFSEYTGLENKTIALDMTVIGDSYLSVKNQVQEAATIAHSAKTWTKLYIQRYDRYYTALNEKVQTQKVVGSSMRFLTYGLSFEAKPWLESDTVTTISGVGTVDTGTRSLDNGGWTPARVKISGTNVTVSGYTAAGEFTGFISVSGTVTNMIIDSEEYTSTISGVNSENQMYNPDYALFVAPGTTYFEIDGATDCEIQYRDRWYL